MQRTAALISWAGVDRLMRMGGLDVMKLVPGQVFDLSGDWAASRARLRRCAQEQPGLERCTTPSSRCRKRGPEPPIDSSLRRYRLGLDMSEVPLILIESIAIGCPSRCVLVDRRDRERHVRQVWIWSVSRRPASTPEERREGSDAGACFLSGDADSSSAALSRFSLGRRPSPSSSTDCWYPSGRA